MNKFCLNYIKEKERKENEKEEEKRRSFISVSHPHLQKALNTCISEWKLCGNLKHPTALQHMELHSRDETKALTHRCPFLQITEEEEKESLLRHSLHDSLDRHTVL